LVNSEQAAERATPHDLAAEQRVLGALLIDRDAIFRVADLLRAEDFYQAKHQRVYRAAQALLERRERIDPLSMQVAATALSQRLQRALVAEPFNQHDRTRAAATGQRASCCDERGTGIFRVRSRLLVHVTYLRNSKSTHVCGAAEGGDVCQPLGETGVAAVAAGTVGRSSRAGAGTGASAWAIWTSPTPARTPSCVRG